MSMVHGTWYTQYKFLLFLNAPTEFTKNKNITLNLGTDIFCVPVYT